MDTCRVANAIETFDVRLRNEGFSSGGVTCRFPQLPTAVGRAVTAKIRTSTPPPVGHVYHDRTDWWTYILSVPPPRFAVVEDIDERPGTGAFVGEVHANILQALGCTGLATNGAVRDLSAVAAIGFQMFSAAVAPSHAFAHVIEFGGAVDVAGLHVDSGALVVADCHGLVLVPEGLADGIPSVVADMKAREQAVIDFCRSPGFSVEGLRSIVQQLG